MVLLGLIGGCSDIALDRARPSVVSDGDGAKPLVATRTGSVLDVLPTPTPSPLAPPVVPDVPGATAPAAAEEVGQPQPTIASAALGSVDGEGGQSAVRAAFLAGYRWGGGDPAWEEHLVNVIQCESGWNLDPSGIHLGLAQFAPGTWEKAAGVSGLWDYTDPYHVGYNVAVWMAMIPGRWGTTAGWPHCWWN